MATVDRKKMGDLHEDFLAELTGGRRTRGSGNQWRDQGDTHDNRLVTQYAFAIDGKSTRGASITVTREMIDKIREQSGGERPALGLRWYDNDRLTQIAHDWVAIGAMDFSELLAAARESHAEGRQRALGNVEFLASLSDQDLDDAIAAMDPGKRRHLREILFGEVPALNAAPPRDMSPEELQQFGKDLDSVLAAGQPRVPLAGAEVTPWADDLALQEDLRALLEALSIDEDQVAGLSLHDVMVSVTRTIIARGAQPAPPAAPPIPSAAAGPMTIVFSVHVPDQRRIVHQGFSVSETGVRSTFEVTTMRLERTIGHQQRLFINEAWARNAEWYLNGQLQYSSANRSPG